MTKSGFMYRVYSGILAKLVDIQTPLRTPVIENMRSGGGKSRKSCLFLVVPVPYLDSRRHKQLFLFRIAILLIPFMEEPMTMFFLEVLAYL